MALGNCRAGPILLYKETGQKSAEGPAQTHREGQQLGLGAVGRDWVVVRISPLTCSFFSFLVKFDQARSQDEEGQMRVGRK